MRKYVQLLSYIVVKRDLLSNSIVIVKNIINLEGINFDIFLMTGGRLTKNQLIEIVFYQLTKIFDTFQLIEKFDQVK